MTCAPDSICGPEAGSLQASDDVGVTAMARTDEVHGESERGLAQGYAGRGSGYGTTPHPVPCKQPNQLIAIAGYCSHPQDPLPKEPPLAPAADGLLHAWQQLHRRAAAHTMPRQELRVEAVGMGINARTW